MALSGTLETFSLHDVLHLLSSTDKVGLLSLTGDRGRGHVWVERGKVVQASTDHAGAEGISGALFDLLRFTRGSFSFEAGIAPSDRSESATTVEGALEAAEALLAEWREIETVVPSLSVAVHLTPEIQTSVSVKPTHWRVLARVGSGATAAALADGLDLLELDMCRMLRDMVENGMIEISQLDAIAETATAAPFVAPSFAAGTIGSDDWTPPETIDPEAVADDDTRSAYAWSDQATEDTNEDDTDGDAETELTVDIDLLTIEAPEQAESEDHDEAVEAPALATSSVPTDPDPVVEESADDFLAQLANLSPRAAAAIEAVEASESDTPSAEQGEAEPAWGTDWPEDDPTDDEPASVPAASVTPTAPSADGDAESSDNLLLRFLSSNKN